MTKEQWEKFRVEALLKRLNGNVSVESGPAGWTTEKKMILDYVADVDGATEVYYSDNNQGDLFNQGE